MLKFGLKTCQTSGGKIHAHLGQKIVLNSWNNPRLGSLQTLAELGGLLSPTSDSENFAVCFLAGTCLVWTGDPFINKQTMTCMKSMKSKKKGTRVPINSVQRYECEKNILDTVTHHFVCSYHIFATLVTAQNPLFQKHPNREYPNPISSNLRIK